MGINFNEVKAIVELGIMSVISYIYITQQKKLFEQQEKVISVLAKLENQLNNDMLRGKGLEIFNQNLKKNEERENTLDKSSPMHTVRECSLFYELGMHHSDRELVLAFQAGKYHCFETLYEHALPKVYRYLLFKTNGNKTLAQDLCSETFLAGFEGLGSFQADENCNF